jgi:deoxyribonuclease-4
VLAKKKRLYSRSESGPSLPWRCSEATVLPGSAGIVASVLFGAHVSSSGGIHRAIDRAESFGCDAVQVFTQSPRTWRTTNHDPSDFAAFKQRAVEAGIESALCHALYLLNLASPDDEIYSKSVATLRNTMEVARGIDADGVVFHVGSHLGAGFAAGLERVIPALRPVLELSSERTWLLIENSAGAGGTIGRSIEELAVLVDALDRHPRLGICLDSCHLYVSGYDVTDATALDTLVAEVDERIGLDRLRALHVNDSKAPLGSNRDRHDNIGEGLLGDGLGLFLTHPAFQELPALLEVPGRGHGPDAEQVAKLRKLHARTLRKSTAKEVGAGD